LLPYKQSPAPSRIKAGTQVINARPAAFPERIFPCAVHLEPSSLCLAPIRMRLRQMPSTIKDPHGNESKKRLPDPRSRTSLRPSWPIRSSPSTPRTPSSGKSGTRWSVLHRKKRSAPLDKGQTPPGQSLRPHLASGAFLPGRERQGEVECQAGQAGCGKDRIPAQLTIENFPDRSKGEGSSPSFSASALPQEPVPTPPPWKDGRPAFSSAPNQRLSFAPGDPPGGPPDRSKATLPLGLSTALAALRISSSEAMISCLAIAL